MPRHFSKVFFSPYFQSDHYKEENVGGIIESKIERFFSKIMKKNGNKKWMKNIKINTGK